MEQEGRQAKAQAAPSRGVCVVSLVVLVFECVSACMRAPGDFIGKPQGYNGNVTSPWGRVVIVREAGAGTRRVSGLAGFSGRGPLVPRGTVRCLVDRQGVAGLSRVQ